MHIADGIISPEVCAGMAVASAGAVGFSLRQLKKTETTKTIPLTGMMGALVFAGQMVNFPLVVAPVSGHLLGGVLASVILGPWAGCLVVTLVLVVQWALFADGGMVALGVNVFNMGVVGALGGYAVYAGLRRWMPSPRGTITSAVIAAWLSVLAASTMFCLEFALSGHHDYSLPNLFALMTTFHSVIGLGEALITGFVLSVVLDQRPDLVYGQPSLDIMETETPRPSWQATPLRTAVVGLMVALAVAGFLAPFASGYSDGLEAVAEKMGFDAHVDADPQVLVLDEYQVPLGSDDSWFMSKLSVSIAGIGGTLAVFAMALLLGRGLKPGTEAGHAS